MYTIKDFLDERKKICENVFAEMEKQDRFASELIVGRGIKCGYPYTVKRDKYETYRNSWTYVCDKHDFNDCNIDADVNVILYGIYHEDNNDTSFKVRPEHIAEIMYNRYHHVDGYSQPDRAIADRMIIVCEKGRFIPKWYHWGWPEDEDSLGFYWCPDPEEYISPDDIPGNII